MSLIKRPRRLRNNMLIREMARETKISKSSLIYPVFVQEGQNIIEDIPSLPCQKRYSPDTLGFILEKASHVGVKNILLFGIPDKKDEYGSSAWAEDGVVQKALQNAKKQFPDLCYITDVCLCEYTSHGHCGVLNNGMVDNDKTLPIIARTALSHVQAGADMVAPSDMMDGRVKAIRTILDENSYENIPVMSYAVKYSSAFYGPFREAAGSCPSFGDRKGYQMDYYNAKEALLEAELDIEEGADILMVKPALSYLDIIHRVSDKFNSPVAAYSVSGEYAMIKAAAAAGLVNEKDIVCETAISIYRAGADILISYSALELADYINKGIL